MIAPLDISTLLLNHFAGSSLIFIGVALLMVGMGAGRFRMPNVILAMMMALLGIMIMPIAQWFYILVLIIGGILVGYVFTRFQR